MEFQGTNFLCLTKSEHLKLNELKIYSKTFLNIMKIRSTGPTSSLNSNRTYFQFKQDLLPV